MGLDFLRSGAAPREKLDRLEKKIADLKVSIDDVRDAPIPLDDVRARLKVRLAGAVYWKTPENDFQSFTQAEAGFASLPQSIGLEHFCYLYGIDHVIDLIMSRIKASGYKPGLALAARPKRIAELQRELHQAEVDAETETLRLEAEGYTILRRLDANLDVMLAQWNGKASAEVEA